MLGIIIGAGVLGGIIAVLEEGEFPGFLPMIACILAASIPAAIINTLLPREFFFIGLAVGAVCAGFAISALCGMSVKRSMLAVGIYFVVMIVLDITLAMLMA